jgi:hypothetical protein
VATAVNLLRDPGLFAASLETHTRYNQRSQLSKGSSILRQEFAYDETTPATHD